MKVEIWSDVVCPFCYIGKRRFEEALQDFKNSSDIEIEWKSFQLSPETKTDTTKNINQFLAEHKGISVEEARRMHDHVTQMAAGVGLVYDFDKAVVANTFNAHRFIHFAKYHGKQLAAEERVFHIYFTEGENIDDYLVLTEVAKEIGLDPLLAGKALEQGDFAEEVLADVMEAQQLGIRGVPFFVFDRKYAVSGAQQSEVFLQTLERSFSERASVNS